MKRTKILAMLLSLAMVFSLLPISVFAAQPQADVSSGYVLMNIPYDAFYEAESEAVDAISTATLKFENPSVAGGSYHETDAATDAESVAVGVTYPVFVSDLSILDTALEITDETTKTINLVSGREKTITPTEVNGADALFCAPSYSWYRLSETPAVFKALALEDGSFRFEAITGESSSAEVSTSVSYDTHHGNEVEIVVNGTGIQSSDTVNGVVVRFDDGSTLGLPHVQGIWSRTQIGFPQLGELAGKTITNIRYITGSGLIDCAVNIKLSGAEDRGYVLMNIPYADFYRAEGVEDVDAVTAATKKAYSLAPGSYHDGVDETYASTDILGVSYPVFVSDLSILGEPAADESALAAAGDYAYIKLETAPNAYKALTKTEEGYSFGAVSGRPTALQNVTAEETVLTKRGDYELALSGEAMEEIKNGTVYGVILTTDSGAYALRHLENIWKNVELAVCTGHTETIKNGAVTPVSYDLEGKTVTQITFYYKTAENVYKKANIPAELLISAYPQAEFTHSNRVQMTGLSQQELTTLAENGPDSGAAKYYSLTLRDGETVLAEGLPIAVDGSVEFDAVTVVGKTYTLEIVQTNTKKNETAVLVSMEAICETKAPVNPFVDVKEGKYYYNAVLWAVNHDPRITVGTTDTTFEPKKNCTRAEVVTFLWRAAGAPEPTVTETSFTDVKMGRYYSKAVLWAVEKGITCGTSADTFSPNADCSRGEIVTFLRRFAGTPEPESTSCRFTDLKANAYYYKAVLWAVENGITAGTTDTTFSPKDPCTRGQAVTFLYRACRS